MYIKKTIGFLVPLLVIILTFAACGGQTTPSSPTTAAPTTSVQITTTAPAPISTTTSTATPTSAPTTTAAAPLPAYLQVSTGDATSFAIDSALLFGNIVSGQGIDQHGFQWGASAGQYGFSFIDKGSFSPGVFSYKATGLADGTTYFYRAMAHNADGWVYGEEKTFKTLGIPRVNTLTPGTGLLGQSVKVTISGLYFTEASAVSFGAGVTVKEFIVSGDTQIVVDITIASGTSTGFRTVSITTPNGTGVAEGVFAIQQSKLVGHSVIWTNDKFNEMIHYMTADSAVQYTLQFHDGNEVTLLADKNVPFWVVVQNGKLVFQNVPQNYWDTIFSAASGYLSYNPDTKELTFNDLPLAYLQTLFDIPKDTMPVLDRAATGEGKITIYYSSMDIVF